MPPGPPPPPPPPPPPTMLVLLVRTGEREREREREEERERAREQQQRPFSNVPSRAGVEHRSRNGGAKTKGAPAPLPQTYHAASSSKDRHRRGRLAACPRYRGFHLKAAGAK
jgi:hypothetical protein